MNEDTRCFEAIVDGVRDIYGAGPTPLHRPVFSGREREYLVECVDSNIVSSIGDKVDEFEKKVAEFTGAKYAVATVSGTTALHVALQLAGVSQEDEVITQPLTFVATCNAIRYCGANPVFVDVDRDSLGLSPKSLKIFLQSHAEEQTSGIYNRSSGRRFAACIPMHTYGFPCRIQEIVAICEEYGIPVVEDAAESLGSYVGDQHTGTFGKLGTISFNGNKVITTGGGGMIITEEEELALKAKHLSTTAKVPHKWEMAHDCVGYNYRLPNLNAALGCAQMERLPEMLAIKEDVALRYSNVLRGGHYPMLQPLQGTTSNRWVNSMLMSSKDERNAFLEYANNRDVMARPAWRLMNYLPPYTHCQSDGLSHSHWLEDRIVNLPSSVPDDAM